MQNKIVQNAKCRTQNIRIFSFAFCILSFAFVAQAQTGFTSNLGNFPGGVFTVTTLVNIVRRLACYFIRFGIVSVVAAFIFYGIMFLKSRGSAQEFGGAKKALTWGIVGGLVIFGVFTIILSVADFIGVSYPILTIVQCS